MVTQRHPEEEDPGISGLYQIGTIARIKQLVKMPGGIIRGDGGRGEPGGIDQSYGKRLLPAGGDHRGADEGG